MTDTYAYNGGFVPNRTDRRLPTLAFEPPDESSDVSSPEATGVPGGAGPGPMGPAPMPKGAGFGPTEHGPARMGSGIGPQGVGLVSAGPGLGSTERQPKLTGSAGAAGSGFRTATRMGSALADTGSHVGTFGSPPSAAPAPAPARSTWSPVVQRSADLLPPTVAEPDRPPVPDRPLTVAHVGPYFLRGGAEQWLLELVAGSDPRYVRFVRSVATETFMTDLEYVDALAAAGVPMEAGGAESVRKAAREADVLLSWGVCLDALLGDVRPPLSVHVVHGDGPWARRHLCGSRGSVDHVVAVSHGVKDRVCEGVPTTVVYNGVDAARIAPRDSPRRTRRVLGFGDADFVVGFVGRFAEEKRPAVVLDAVSRLPERFKVLLVGWGSLLPDLREQAARLLPGRHVITYAFDGLGDLYRAMDAVCLVSNQEGFPLVMLEAMLCRRPIVSTPVGCIPELIEDRVNGLWTTGAPDDLAAALARLGERPQWARGLAEEGFALAERFGYARRMARDYEHLLHRLFREKQSNGRAAEVVP